jgi:hypothetical protein
MKSRLKNILLSGAVLMGASLAAQDTTRWDAGGAYLIGLDGLKSVTGSGQGYNVQAGFNGHIAESGVPFRASLQIYQMPWDGNDPANTGLRDTQLACDVFTPTSYDKLRLVTGLSINKWVRGEQETSVKGLKFGARIGLDYALTPRWVGEFMIQVVELGTDTHATKGLNPSWAQLGVRYRF